MKENNKPVFKENKKNAKSLSYFDKTLSDLLGFEAGFDKTIIKLYNIVLSEEQKKKLESMSVDELSKAKLGIRIQALKDAGINNISQLSSIPVSSLEKIKGIGAKSAEGIKRTIGPIIESVKSNTKITIDPNHPTKSQADLVQNLYFSQKGRKINENAKKLNEEFHPRIQQLLKDSLPARSWFVWTFSGEKKREISLQSLEQIKELLSSDYINRVNSLELEKVRILKVKHDEYWKDFKGNAAGYYATLDRIVNKRNRGENQYKKNQSIAIQNGMSPELAVAISNIHLNLNGLYGNLRPYQLYGIQFIIKQGAVLLGDEMGLGKTVQAIASIVCMRNSGGTHFLIICPASVLVNWGREIKEWCDIPYMLIHGSTAVDGFNKWIRQGGIGVTTYETLAKLRIPSDFTYSMLIVDEAHYVKNPQAARTQNVLYFRQRTARVVFMTGIPIENRVEEMCFLIGCLQPNVARSVAGSTSLSMAPEFRKLVAPVYFRRTKEDVLDELPEKVESKEWVNMTDEEINRYRALVKDGKFAQMRQVSWLINSPQNSSKGQRLIEIVNEAIGSGHKVIVFSFFLETMEQVGKILQVKTFGPITGAVSPAKRQSIIDEFTNYSDGAVLLSQIQAGGTGLNIQAASYIIFCEPQLKPSIENQAIARAYRMGQINTVMVYHLLCEKAVDERIDQLLSSKQEIFNNFADKSVSGQESLISNADITSILELEQRRWA